jgi:hypothetical protein
MAAGAEFQEGSPGGIVAAHHVESQQEFVRAAEGLVSPDIY